MQALYQLVLQFGEEALSSLEDLIALEDALIEELEDSADVDGHDIGSGQANIFVITPDLAKTFERAKAVLNELDLLAAVTAAYRTESGSDYTVLWPHHVRSFSIS
ncbi:hypothetical protein [Hydrocarboniphaga effusa]|jgi:hypothetical protein|uniref:hypothetical protein n=1 Tax=Hydrocarboniphaga effusa TaxID=243629 RepID=UPI003137A3AD